LSPAPAAADSRFHARVAYELAPSLTTCADEGEFKKKIARRVGYDPFRSDADVSVSVRVDGTTAAIGGTVFWVDAQGTSMGERRFVAKDGNCAKLVSEMGFAVALQIQMLGPAAADPATPLAPESTDTSGTGATGTAGTTPTPPPPPPSPEQERTPETAPEATSPQPDHPVSLWLGVGPQAALGIAPSMAGQGRVFVGLRRGALSWEAGGEASYPMTFRRWGGSGFREMLIEASLAGCYHTGRWAGCVLGKAGQLRASGEKLDEPLSPTGFVAHAGARVAGSIDLSRRWFVTAHVDGLVLLTPRTIELGGFEIWKMPTVGTTTGLDLALRFR
jgi:hypothetical protein